jgi:hypothetical protein
VVYEKKEKISKFSNPNIVEDLLKFFFSFENDNKTNPPYDPHLKILKTSSSPMKMLA